MFACVSCVRGSSPVLFISIYDRFLQRTERASLHMGSIKERMAALQLASERQKGGSAVGSAGLLSPPRRSIELPSSSRASDASAASPVTSQKGSANERRASAGAGASPQLAAGLIQQMNTQLKLSDPGSAPPNSRTSAARPELKPEPPADDPSKTEEFSHLTLSRPSGAAKRRPSKSPGARTSGARAPAAA